MATFSRSTPLYFTKIKINTLWTIHNIIIIINFLSLTNPNLINTPTSLILHFLLVVIQTLFSGYSTVTSNGFLISLYILFLSRSLIFFFNLGHVDIFDI